MMRFLIVALLIAAADAQVVKSSAGHKIMIFGGENHKIYLGCLSCSASAGDSVLNPYGSNGSKYSGTSIFNIYSEYGGKYGDNSPCNKYTSHPPVIVDEDGGYYGELTVNDSSGKRTNSEILNSWISGVCQAQ